MDAEISESLQLSSGIFMGSSSKITSILLRDLKNSYDGSEVFDCFVIGMN